MPKQLVKKKICLLGDPAVGKTSLIRRYVHGLFDEDYTSTLGAVITKKALGDIFGYDLELMIWDIMGSKTLAEVPRNYVKGATGAVVVADITREETMHDLMDWAALFTRYAGDRPYLFIANKRDLVDEGAIARGARLIMDLDAANNAVSVLSTSAKTGENVEQLFQTLGRAMLGTELERLGLDRALEDHIAPPEP